MASRKYIEGMMTLTQRLNAEARRARLLRKQEELQAQLEALDARLAADMQARINSGELVLRGRAE